MTGDIQYNIG